MGMFDSTSVYMNCPICHQWGHFDLQTKDLACGMDIYTPLPEDWFTNPEEGVGGQRKFRLKLSVYPKFPKDKEQTVWENQAERAEASASLEEPYASQLIYVNFYGNCPLCKAWLEGKIRVENGKLIGTLIDVTGEK